MLATVPLQGNKNVVFFRLRHEHFAVRFLHCQLGFWAASSAFLYLNTIIKGNERSPVNQQGAKKCRYYWGYLSNISDCSWTQRQEEISASKFTSSLGVHCILSTGKLRCCHCIFRKIFPTLYWMKLLQTTQANVIMEATHQSDNPFGTTSPTVRFIFIYLPTYMRVFPFVVVTT